MRRLRPARTLPFPASWRRAAAVALAAIAGASLPAAALAAAGDAEAGGTSPVQACERAARQALTPGVGPRPEVSFETAPTVDASLSNDSQTVLRGSGRSRGAAGARTFNYVCNVDRNTADAVGVVIRDSTPPVARPAPARKPAEPDLSEVSPAACESSAVQALKRRWPRVTQITFDTDTRSFRQETAASAELVGRGRALPAPGAPSTLFGFECRLDPRDGRIYSTSISG